MKVKDLLNSRARWTRGKCARDKHGHGVEPLSPRACRWCLIGAIDKCYPEDNGQIFRKIVDGISPVTGECLSGWNDRVGFEQVRDLVRRLDV